MARSQNWPDLWWQISKIWDIQVVGIYDLMKRWRFETNRISSVATAQPQSQKPVFDFDLTWWPDLWWPGAEIFTQGVKFNCEQVLKKWRRCAPSFFRYPRKTGGVGIFCPPPPSSARVKVLGQPVTSEVRSSAKKSRKHAIADNFASKGATAKLQRPASSLRRVNHVSMFYLLPSNDFLEVKN